jgi:hypothetical protein
MSKLTPQQFLNQLHANHSIDESLQIVQKKYPGKYTLVEYFDNKLGRFNYRLNFFDAKDELMWKIKYS